MAVQCVSYALGLSKPAYIYKCYGVLTSAMEAVELLFKTLEYESVNASSGQA